MEKIKVAEVITRLDWGGSPDIVRIICSYLSPELYDITLVTGPTEYPSAKTKEFIKKFNPKIIIIPELKRDINPIGDLTALIRLYFLFRRQNFDIVHTHTAKAGTLGRIAAVLSGKSIIVHTLHGHNFYGYFSPFFSKIIVFIEKITAYFTDKIIVLTELEREDLLRFKVTEAGKMRLIYPGLELDKYARINIDKVKMRKNFNIAPDETLVGMIGRLEPIKGPEYFVEAAADVARQFTRTKFIMVGEGSLRVRLERQVECLGLANRFIFTGWRNDIPEILSILDILVLPSLNEGVGMILVEAQAMGVPIVATRVGGVPEVVKDNQTGILVPAADSHRLAGAIKQLLTDEQKRWNIAQTSVTWVRSKFKAQDMVNAVSDLYQELVSSKR